MRRSSLAVFLHSHYYDRLYQAMGLLLTASSMGRPCHLFLFYGALASFVEGTWDEVNLSSTAIETRSTCPPWIDTMQDAFEHGSFPSLYEMLEKARAESGGVKVFACSTSCKVLGLDLGAVRAKADEIVGLPTMMQIIESVEHVLYI